MGWLPEMGRLKGLEFHIAKYYAGYIFTYIAIYNIVTDRGLQCTGMARDGRSEKPSPAAATLGPAHHRPTSSIFCQIIAASHLSENDQIITAPISLNSDTVTNYHD